MLAAEDTKVAYSEFQYCRYEDCSPVGFYATNVNFSLISGFVQLLTEALDKVYLGWNLLIKLAFRLVYQF